MSDEPPRRRQSDYEPVAISKAEMRDIFREESGLLIKQTFNLLGIDISDSDTRNKLRDDFVWLRGVRTASDDAAKIVRKVGVTAAITFLIGVMAAGIKMSLKALS